MTTAFVLGGGGLLGAHEVGMLRALAEARAGQYPVDVYEGNGPALVFFHGPWGLTWDPFLDELARRFTVHAPEHPGTTPGASLDSQTAVRPRTVWANRSRSAGAT